MSALCCRKSEKICREPLPLWLEFEAKRRLMALKSQGDNARGDCFWYPRLLTIEHLRRLRGLSGRRSVSKAATFFFPRATLTWRGLFSKSHRDRRGLLFSVRSFLREGIHSIVSTCRKVPIEKKRKRESVVLRTTLSRKLVQSRKVSNLSKILIVFECYRYEHDKVCINMY